MSRILIIDDDPEYRGFLKEILQEADFDEIAEAGSGDEALQTLNDARFEVILLDLIMPGMDGMETLREIRRNDERSKIVMITAFASVENAVDAIKAGANDYIAKPFKVHELVTLIRRLLEETKFEERIKINNFDQALGALANPLRRDIVALLGEQGPTRLMRIAQNLAITDHTKVVFHLKSLKESGIVEQKVGKAYALTQAGKRLLKGLGELKTSLEGRDGSN